MRILRSTLVIGFTMAMTQAMVEAQAGGTRVWSLGLSATETFDSNANLGRLNDSQADLMSRVGINFGFSQSGERLTLNANASTGALLFTNLSDQNNFTVNAGFGADYQVTDRTSLSLAQSVSQDFSYNTTVLTNQGIVLPLVLARSVSSSASLSHQMSERTSVSGSVSFDRIFIDDPVLVGGSTFSVGVRFEL